MVPKSSLAVTPETSPRRVASHSSAPWVAAAATGLLLGAAACSKKSEPAPAGGTAVSSAQADKNCCVGKNDCKGKGGCAVEGANGCAGQNECKGKGGCNMHCPK